MTPAWSGGEVRPPSGTAASGASTGGARSTAGSSALLAGGGALLVAGIVAVAFNLRAAITSLPPVFPELSSAAGLSAATLAVVAAVPVLSFGVISVLAPRFAHRHGEERVIGLALILLAGGLALRAAAPVAGLFPGTIVACGAIALMNVLVPSLIKRRTPDRAGWLIGLYMMTLTVGAVIAAAIAVPVFRAAGGSTGAVKLTLGMWAVPALIGAFVWLPQLKFRTVAQAEGGRRGVLAMSRNLVAWQVTAFMGLQSLSYYATLSWFPTMFRDHGIGAVQAGNLLALMNVGNAITGLLIPVLAHRVRDQRPIAAAAVGLIMIGLAGSAFAPNAVVVVFVAVLGLGQGGAFSLAIFLFTARAADGHTSAALSGFAQGVGYLIASLGPLLLGFLHTATGGWSIPVELLIVVAAGQLWAGLLASRDRTIGAGSNVQP